MAALARMLARRRRRYEPTPRELPPVTSADDPADALRRKLTEAREGDDAATPTADDAATAAPKETIEERRARVHAKAQEAIDAMQDPIE